MAPINPVALKATVSNFVKNISAGGNKVNILKETENLLTSVGKSFKVDRGNVIKKLSHEAGTKSLNVVEISGHSATIGGVLEEGKDFFYQIFYKDGKILENCTEKTTSISEEAKQILFEILA